MWIDHINNWCYYSIVMYLTKRLILALKLTCSAIVVIRVKVESKIIYVVLVQVVVWKSKELVQGGEPVSDVPKASM